ncbi:MAG TPA: AAC(3) family N-acetyltransferase, partial [Patescibacteria group bacterium]|nr:AAC(3) family N-acetyltransferase [Patescibacteria group bacterium]
MPAASIQQIADDLARLGVAQGDLVMVHASLKAVGPVEGGAEGLIEALECAVGADGTLLMTLGARDPMAWVNDLPESARPAALAGSEPFDHLVTPADPDVGVLAEVFRRLPGTVAQNHPEGRF